MIVAMTIVMASSFNYFFIGPMPMWLALGAVALGHSFLNSRVRAALKMSGCLCCVVAAWLALIVFTTMLDLVGSMPRDLMIGPVLNLLTLFAFLGIFTLTTLIKNNRIVATLFIITVFQALLAIAQYLGSETAWRFPDLVGQLLPLARIEYSDLFDISLMEFQKIGRVRGSVPLVHVFTQIQATLVSFCIIITMSSNRIRFHSWRLSILAWGAAVLGSVSLFLTFSRSGVLVLIGATALGMILNLKSSRILLVAIGVVIISLIMIYLNISESPQFYRLVLNFDEGARNFQRYDQYDLAWRNFYNNPLIGASGPNGYPDLLLPIHSVPMRYLNDYGFIGFFLYICVFGGFATLFLRRLKSPSPTVGAWAGCGLAVLLVVAVDSWTHSSGFLRRDLLQTAMLAFVSGAMLAAEWRAGLGRARGQRFSRPRPNVVTRGVRETRH